MRSALEETLALQLRALCIAHEREFAFARQAIGNPRTGIRAALKAAGLRDWRFDFALVQLKIAVEIEGGVFTGGRHTRGKGFQADCEKYNQATVLGWAVLRFTASHIQTGQALEMIQKFSRVRLRLAVPIGVDQKLTGAGATIPVEALPPARADAQKRTDPRKQADVINFNR